MNTIYVQMTLQEGEAWNEPGVDVLLDQSGLLTIIRTLTEGEAYNGKTVEVSPNPSVYDTDGLGEIIIPGPEEGRKTYAVLAVYAPGAWMKVSFE